MMEYMGNELALFSQAQNWKEYFSEKLRPYIQGEVLEVGAGLGVNSKYLVNPQVISWHSLEPDEELCRQISTTEKGYLPRHTLTQGTIGDLEGRVFDKVLYIDVLEHIEKSSQELETLKRLLRPGGRLIILVPAYNFLFSEFDRAIGHFRRYNKALLKREVPVGYSQERLFTWTHLEWLLP